MAHHLLAVEIHNRIVYDTHHPQLYESTQRLLSAPEVALVLLQFLDLHTSLRQKLSYDNLYPVFLDLFRLLRPDFCGVEQDVYYITFFIKQDFLHDNLRRKK